MAKIKAFIVTPLGIITTAAVVGVAVVAIVFRVSSLRQKVANQA